MVKELILLVAGLAAVVHGFGSLEDCNEVVSHYKNTCSEGPADSVSAIPSETVTCYDMQSCPGTQSGNKCEWERKLCASCWEDKHGTVKVRVQSNGLPNHCFYSPFAPVEKNDDYEAIFSAEITRTVQDPSTQDQVNNVLCDIMRTANRNIPTESKPIQHGNNMDTSVGTTITGVNMYNALSADDVDPYYPAVYGHVTNITEATEHVDFCLGHPNPPLTYHYHIGSPCLFGEPSQNKPCLAEYGCDAKTFFNAAFDKEKKPMVIGIARDGRVVYGPYESEGKRADKLDICKVGFPYLR